MPSRRYIEPRLLLDWVQGEVKGGTYNNGTHAGSVLAPCKVCSKDKNDDGDRNGSDSQGKLCIGSSGNNDDKLHGEAQEEEEIKFQQGNVDLNTN
jgi:hypothetical protein